MIKGLFPSVEDILGKAVTSMLAIPEGILMLTVAIFLDACGLLLFILSFAGVGIPLSWMLDAGGIMIFGIWMVTRSILREVIKGVIGKTLGKTLKDHTGTEKTSTSTAKMKKGIQVAKKGVGRGLSLVRFGISTVIELIPFLGDIFPSWTLLVIFEIISGEIES